MTKKYAKLKETLGRAVNGNSEYGELQNDFENIKDLKEFGIIGIDRTFLFNLAQEEDKTVKRRISRLLRKSTHLKKEFWAHYKRSTRYNTKLYHNQLLRIIERPNKEDSEENGRNWVSKLGDRNSLGTGKEIREMREQRDDQIIECYRQKYDVSTGRGIKFVDSGGRKHGHFSEKSEDQDKELEGDRRIREMDTEEMKQTVISIRENGIPQ